MSLARRLVWPAMLGLALLSPAAAEAEAPRATDPVLDTLAAEIERAMGSLAGSDAPPYFIAIELVESDAVHIVGESGGLHDAAPARRRWADVDVRIGSRELDSSHPLRSGQARGGGEDGGSR